MKEFEFKVWSVLRLLSIALPLSLLLSGCPSSLPIYTWGQEQIKRSADYRDFVEVRLGKVSHEFYLEQMDATDRDAPTEDVIAKIESAVKAGFEEALDKYWEGGGNARGLVVDFDLERIKKRGGLLMPGELSYRVRVKEKGKLVGEFTLDHAVADLGYGYAAKNIGESALLHMFYCGPHPPLRMQCEPKE